MTTSADLNLTASGSFGAIGDALFMTGQLQSAGTAAFSSFVQIQNNGTEQGYNTDAAPQYNEKSTHTHNHSVLLAEVPIVYGDGSNGTVAGVAYREFLLNVNEISGSRQLLSLDKLQLWQTESGGLTDFTPGTGFVGSVINSLAYDLDAGGDRWIALTDLTRDGGRSDYRVLIPDSAFVNDAVHRYVTLFSQFGAQGNGWSTDGGFEEWGLHAPSGGTVSALALTAAAYIHEGTAERAGEIILYQFTLSNTGNTAHTGVTLTDLLTSDLARDYDLYGNGDDVLDVGEMWSYYGHHTVTQAEIDSKGGGDGRIANIGTVHSDQVAPVSAAAVVLVEHNPHVTLVNAATVPGGTADAAGEEIEYAIAVTNDGNVTLTHPVVRVTLASDLRDVDANGDEFNDGDANHDRRLDVGETWWYAASHTLTQAEIDNTDTNGIPRLRSPILAPVLTPGGFNVGDANHDGVEGLGETFRFVNAGDTNRNGVRDASETFLYAVQRDATASVDTDQQASSSAGASVTIVQAPHITLAGTMTVPGGTADAAGETIGYAIAVTNDGNMTLTHPTVSVTLASGAHAVDADGDGFNDGDVNHDGKLGVGETWHYTASRAVTQADIDAGASIAANAAAETDQSLSASQGAAVSVAQRAHLTLVKSGIWEDAGREIGFAEAGEVIHYTYTLTNDGNVTLADIRLGEPGLGGGQPPRTSGDVNGNTVLDVGETWVFQRDYEITRADVDAGVVHSEADAGGTTAQNRFALAHTTVDVALPQAPGMTLDISDRVGTRWVDANGNGVADADGDFIQFSVVLRNVTENTLTSLAASDLLGEAVAANLRPPVPASLTPVNTEGEAWFSSYSHVLTAADVAAGHVFEELTVTALDWQSHSRAVSAHWDQWLPV